ncbi:MAG: DegT/DnrJ/EryC1/StrS family aminotransferase [Candidatus Colwellbacteria bacterium]|nr:DegT/DnrJ/EryC1/StrS family aminotransferase [Candidatus Colwellbacteria bacterium]
MRKIPLSKARIGKEEESSMVEALRSGWLTHGPKNKEFEEAFASYIGTKYAISMNSCASVLFAVIKAAGITGEVILPSFTFTASANAVVNAGAKPVFTDVDYDTCMLDPKSVEEAITPKTEAIMVVHFAGQAGPLKELKEIVDKHELLLIEDSAEAIGAEYNGKKTGSFGEGCFSFWPTKNMTTGEGGMLTTNNQKLAEQASLFVAHGIKKAVNPPHVGYRSAVLPGFNFRLSNMLAAIGVEQLKKLDAMNESRRIAAGWYNDRLSKILGITLPVEKPGRKHVYQMYTIKVAVDKRNTLVSALNNAGVEASVHFNPPVHLQDYYKKKYPAHLPITEKIAEEIVTLPMYPDITKEDISYVCDTIRANLA